uniref:Uncharacterized protein n=1 Tax=Oncorhynchus tshawytscha TaxID=74940 RepID=A0AAZ3R2U5_ONCTS
MLMGFLGCLGAIYEIRCLLGLVSTGTHTQAQAHTQTHTDTHRPAWSDSQSVVNYPGKNSTTEQAWDYIQRTMECCGWSGHMDWHGNAVIVNSSQLLFPCSCQNVSLVEGNSPSDSGFCEAQSLDWPIYNRGCNSSVESWLFANVGVILGGLPGSGCHRGKEQHLLGMILSIGLCKSIHTEDYTKVPKY